jgi:hypothetical protein
MAQRVQSHNSAARRWRRWAFIITLVALEASYLAAWFVAKKSDAYAEAERFVRSSGVVAENVGSITSVSLEPFGLSLRFSGAGARVAFEMAVEASRASGTADVELAKNGTWRVLAARLTLPNRQPITIAP